MILLDMQTEKSICGEIFPTLDTPIHMGLAIMDLVVCVRGERERLSVRW